jgi:hypothetical protein
VGGLEGSSRGFPKFVRIDAEMHDFNVGSGRALRIEEGGL